MCDWPLLPVTGKASRAGRLSSRYCGVAATTPYDTPFCGLSQKVGATCELPARDATMLLVTSRSVMPSPLAR